MLSAAAVVAIAVGVGCESKAVVAREELPQSVPLHDLSDAITDRFQLCSDREFYGAWVQADVSLLRENSDAVSVNVRFVDATGGESVETFLIPAAAGAAGDGAFKSWALKHSAPGKSKVDDLFCTEWVELELGPVLGATEGRLSWTLTALGEFYFDGFQEPSMGIYRERR